MAYRAMDAEAQEYAHRLREAGVTDVAIAKEMGISARTLNRTLGPRRVQSAKAAKASNRKVREWPTEREWPAEWSADHLVASRVRDRDTALPNQLRDALVCETELVDESRIGVSLLDTVQVLPCHVLRQGDLEGGSFVDRADEGRDA